MLWKEESSNVAHVDTNGKNPMERVALRNALSAARLPFIELIMVVVVGGDVNESCNSYQW